MTKIVYRQQTTTGNRGINICSLEVFSDRHLHLLKLGVCFGCAGCKSTEPRLVRLIRRLLYGESETLSARYGPLQQLVKGSVRGLFQCKVEVAIQLTLIFLIICRHPLYYWTFQMYFFLISSSPEILASGR